MLYSKRPAVLVSLAVLLTSLTACNNSQTAKNLQQAFAADPRLKDNPVAIDDKGSLTQQNPPTQLTVQLPTDFPKEIPLYSNANLQQITPSSSPDGSVSTRWLSSDPSNLIASFYSQQFQANNWQILQQPTDQQAGSFEARRNDLQVKVTIQPKSVTNAAPNQPQTATELLIEYTRNTTAAAQTPTPNDVAATRQYPDCCSSVTNRCNTANGDSRTSKYGYTRSHTVNCNSPTYKHDSISGI